ncbi:aquaporin [Sphingobium sp. BYY-5]|uniref:aquaporin n=1 Tax=Sphingobium sp. BYY-5 TaxID=2926400 RepID=UPI001FA7DAB4|nr:aquaporin [Sphingobium sp. BYY-5]MCI4588515.1 aquaporin [Sphingobium sp. BYY-5]
MKRIAAAEALGTTLLVSAVIGSGIMAERLSGGNMGLALLANSAATGAMLYALITLLGPISGAHLNPVVSLLLAPRAEWAPRIAAQCSGGLLGTALSHLMFQQSLLQVGATTRTGPAQWLAEAIATFGLLLTIRLGARFRPAALPALVAAWIVAAYWFTASTSFANPAVTLARALTNSFAGIRPLDVPAFILAQSAGALAGYHMAGWLLAAPSSPSLQPQESPTS